jgi:ssDNA-binding Zn-finger/Zn-ribbon topoisomerase 1
MGTRPAKLAIRAGRDAGKTKTCPACKNPKMQVVKFVRHSRPSGMFWVCDKCSNEMPTR